MQPVVSCCCELGENNVCHCCSEELGLPEVFCQSRVVVELCVVFFPLSQLGISVDRESLLGFSPFGYHHCYNIEALINDGNNYSEDKTIISCLFFERDFI